MRYIRTCLPADGIGRKGCSVDAKRCAVSRICVRSMVGDLRLSGLFGKRAMQEL